MSFPNALSTIQQNSTPSTIQLLHPKEDTLYVNFVPSSTSSQNTVQGTNQEISTAILFIGFFLLWFLLEHGQFLMVFLGIVMSISWWVKWRNKSSRKALLDKHYMELTPKGGRVFTTQELPSAAKLPTNPTQRDLEAYFKWEELQGIYVLPIPATSAFQPFFYLHLDTKDGNSIRLFQNHLDQEALLYTASLILALWRYQVHGQPIGYWQKTLEELDRPSPTDLMDHLVE